MTQPLLNLSGKIEPSLVDIIEKVDNCATRFKIPYLVVGAFARDLVLHHGYGAPAQRATKDIDFALQVPTWGTFEILKKELITYGFTETKTAHRLIASNNWPIDIVPFGGIADKNTNIQWPPSGDTEMNVLGFQEAFENANNVRLSGEPRVEVLVASPVGMMLLKLISWTDRTADKRKKDAIDIAYVLTTYETIPAISSQLYDDQGLMAHYGWDKTLAGAHQLGITTKTIAESNTAKTIFKLLNNQNTKLQVETLISEMGGRNTHQYPRNEALINAFKAGVEG
ncbi:nucleotidyl transferase AbiEii/AbiGii toxin family protein [Marinagarivorans cellulosilyticus]|uniref:Nucleotidyltransferase n=1 Tax=Marinagarivorans cellulosilyticus TaxID=2721545 RepID=A0AAN1WH22_9GAMM|nr:nucleotidyl transferase AbiEii/AbiGii toxin family protein [Marinagarivorans cellulosilyticus]BCD97462.1 hypothetical protein MARGE09_P1663 [Marinagarivorans cellulosilyticus]